MRIENETINSIANCIISLVKNPIFVFVILFVFLYVVSKNAKKEKTTHNTMYVCFVVILFILYVIELYIKEQNNNSRFLVYLNIIIYNIQLVPIYDVLPDTIKVINSFPCDHEVFWRCISEKRVYNSRTHGKRGNRFYILIGNNDLDLMQKLNNISVSNMMRSNLKPTKYMISKIENNRSNNYGIYIFRTNKNIDRQFESLILELPKNFKE